MRRPGGEFVQTLGTASGSIRGSCPKAPEDQIMCPLASRLPWTAAVLTLTLVGTSPARAACCYFSAKNTDILQPAQKVFLTWDPEEKVETFTVQPKFEGNALDFGMVIPT